jgi:hypothetical protein
MRPRLRGLLVMLAFLFLSSDALAQDARQTERTRVGEYELGETYNEMVPPDAQKKMDTACPQADAQYAANLPKLFLKDEKYQVGDELRTTLAACNAFTDFRAGKDGKFKVPKEELKSGMEAVTVKFHASKIYEVSIVWKLDEITLEIQRLILAQKYGEPTKMDSTNFQNGIGGTWHCEEANWLLKNGDRIMAFDGIVSGHHRVFVNFVSKDKPQESNVKNSH